MVPQKCYIIAEAGLNHNGSMDFARKLIDCAAEAKVDAVKFQKRNVATLAIKPVLDAEDHRFPSLGSSYRQIRQALEFSKEQYLELKLYTESRGLDFICTAFDVESVDFLEEIDLGCYKLASHSITNLPLLKYIASKGKKIIFSTGMCTLDEVDQAVSLLKNNNNELMLLHCVSSYPQSAEESNLNLMKVYSERYGLPVGYSGHELGFTVTLAAAALGAVAVERHFTLDKRLEGFDHKISLEPQELTSMVHEIRTIEKSLGSCVKKISEVEQITRNKYHVSMVSIRDIKKGETITEDLITYKNPGTGLQPKDAYKVIGKRALEDIPCDTIIDTHKVVVSALNESDSVVRGGRTKSACEMSSIAAICPVLKTFDAIKMDSLLKDLRQIPSLLEIYIVSELDQVAQYCKKAGCEFIKRPDFLMPENSTIEGLLQYSVQQIKEFKISPDYILYCNYAFSERPKNLFVTLVDKIEGGDLDTVFPSTEVFSNIWKKKNDDEYIMVGDWLPHQKRDPMYVAVNGLGTITRTCFIEQGKLIGKNVGLVASQNYFTKDPS